MTNFLGDKIIDDQGNVKTIAGGQDAKLYYIDYEGNRKKYLLEGEVGGVKSVNGQSGDVTIETLDIDYQDVNDIQFGNFQYFTCTNTITNINLNIPANLKNTMCLFTTGDSITFNITIDSIYKINKPFEFEPNSNYVIAIDNNTILWTILENSNQ